MKISIHGAHVKQEYCIEVDSIDDISSKVHKDTHNIEHLKANHRWKYRDCIPDDECKVRQCDLMQWCECVSGSESKCGNICRISLMNDEVLWQWRTGSVLVYRFENMKFAKDFYLRLFKDAKISCRSRNDNIFEVGDIVKFNVNVKTPFGYEYKTNDIVRVFDWYDNGFVPTGEDGKTYIRIPGTGGSKLHIDYCCIPKEYATLIKKLV